MIKGIINERCLRTSSMHKPAYYSVQLFDWSTTARKVAVIAADTMLTSKTVLEMTVVGLDRH